MIFTTIASQIMSYIWDRGIEIYAILEGSCKGLFSLVGINTTKKLFQIVSNWASEVVGLVARSVNA